jgi:LacI family transcriptional regulator
VTEKRILVVLEREAGYCSAVLRGIWQFSQNAAAGRNWILRGMNPRGDLSSAKSWNPNGIITGLETMAQAEGLLSFGRPMIDVYDHIGHPKVPKVALDDEEIGRIAAAHLIERGLRSFGFVGNPVHAYVRQRGAGFSHELARQGYDCVQLSEGVAEDAWGIDWGMPGDSALARWLAALPKPAGVFAANDDVGIQVTETCRGNGMSVPEQIAVLGVDNDQVFCASSRPKLSSIKTVPERVGFEAAALLAKAMSGRRPRSTMVRGATLVPRQSTDVLATKEPEVIEAVRWLRSNAHQPITIADLLRQIPVSRRTLEQRFRQVLGHTPYDELRHVRLSMAKDLLASTDLAIPQVARRAGFSSGEGLAHAFQAAVKQSPSAYRNQFRMRE